MNKITAAAAFLVVIIVATATTWFFLNQTNNLNQTNKVRITAFSVDPAGWENPSGYLITCSFNITLQNIGTNDVQGLKLKITMFRAGEDVGGIKQGTIVNVQGVVDVTLYTGEVRNFQGEMHCSTAAIDTIGGHPVGATYVAQVILGNDILDEDEWKAP